MVLLYALVARQRAVLAEYTASSGNFPTVTRVLLSKIQSDTDSKMSYVYDKHVFHYIVDNGITFLCMTDDDYKRRIVFSFLEDVIKIWREKYIAIEQSAIAFSLNDTFSPVLRQRLEFYSSNPSADNIARVQSQIDAVKDVMVENIDRVLERGEKIELLVDKTDRLNQQAFKFERSSRSLKREMLWKKYRNYLLLFVLLVIIAVFIAVMVCGINFDKCKSDKDK